MINIVPDNLACIFPEIFSWMKQKEELSHFHMKFHCLFQWEISGVCLFPPKSLAQNSVVLFHPNAWMPDVMAQTAAHLHSKNACSFLVKEVLTNSKNESIKLVWQNTPAYQSNVFLDLSICSIFFFFYHSELSVRIEGVYHFFRSVKNYITW